MDDICRKSPCRESNTTKIPTEYCCGAEERGTRRYDGQTKNSYHRQGDTTSEHELYKLTEEKTSDEGSVTEVEATDNDHGDVRATYQCESCPKKYENSSREHSGCTYGKYPVSRRPNKLENRPVDDAETGVIAQAPISPSRIQRNFPNYGNPVNFPQALIAMRKLERLKELQRRRDHSEKFYSQEIRRLIGENFFTENTAIVTAAVKNKERIASSVTRPNDNAQNGVEQRTRGGGFYNKDLEPYGTLTTITRLDCGCVEESTIPIFSSSIGRVKKCESHRYQEHPVTKLVAPNPQELSYRSIENPAKLEHLVNGCQAPRIRGKNFADSGQYRNLTNSVSRDLESWDERKVQTRNRRSPRNTSPIRANSPIQKYSDTSSN